MRSSVSTNTPHTVAGPDADAKSFILNTGGAWVRNESVSHVTGEGAKRIAHVRFDSAGQKKLLIKIAPISKL